MCYADSTTPRKRACLTAVYNVLRIYLDRTTTAGQFFGRSLGRRLPPRRAED